jgi:hypothetical protein
MSLTLEELSERMKQVEETELIEKLGLTSEDIVERCLDIIEDRYDEYYPEFDEIERDE